jgi:hypothetical protein
MTYPSRVDTWIAAILIGLALSVPAYAIAALLAADGTETMIFLSIAAFTALLLIGLVWPVRYTLEDDRLVIRFGLVRQRIAYADLEEVAPTRTLISGPALSLDRLAVRHRKGSTLISPKEKDAFLRDLAGRDPGLELVGDTVRRRGA